MQFFKNLSEFVIATREGSTAVHTSRSFDQSVAAKNASEDELPREGQSALLSGHHVYVMLQLTRGLTTSASNDDRQKTITLLADLVHGARAVAHRYGGALLEAQGPVVHVFIPDDDGVPSDARGAAMEIHNFIDTRIKPRAGSDFVKALAAYAHGPTILVGAVTSHADQSIVSLAPAANAPAKVLWRNWEQLPTGVILEVESDGTYRELSAKEREDEVIKSAAATRGIFNSRDLSDVMLIEARAAEMPPASSPDSPTVAVPHKSYSLSIRADIEGFTQRVAGAFHAGEEAMQKLAEEFYEIMVHARSFCQTPECIHLPWAGDCFNLLLSFEDRQSYQDARARRILTVGLRFREHMEENFPQLQWAFSSSGGFLEPAQACNTLVSRLTVGHTTLLLATGLPVERSLEGLVREGPDGGGGVIWKEDVEKLDPDLQAVLEKAHGNYNYHHYELDDVEAADDRHDIAPPPPPYSSPLVPKAVSILVPTVKPHFR